MGEEINITYETLFEILRMEKSREELQKLSPKFFGDVISYLKEKEDIIQAQENKLFFSDEKHKTQLQMQNIRRILTELYDRREKKIINLAVIKTRTNGLVDVASLLPEEKYMFDCAVKILSEHRQCILNSMLNVNKPDMDQLRSNIAVQHNGTELPPEPKVETEVKQEPQIEQTQPEVQEQTQDEKPIENPVQESEEKQIESEPEAAQVEQEKQIEEQPEVKSEPEVQPEQTSPVSVTEDDQKSGKKLVKFTNSVPKFVGPDLEIYGPYSENDTANLPDRVADILIQKNRAEEAMKVTQ